MLLVVVGLLVLVLVILVVVFLSVRSMRDAEEDDYEDRPAARRSPRGGRDDDEDARSRGAARGRQSRSPARRGPAGESWQNDGDVPVLPRPRGYQHDQDQQEQPRRAARSQPRQAAARLTGGDRDRAGKDWSDTDWGGVSDEQYWAELSSDKPLATTARSAQPAPADRAATTAMAAVAATSTAKPGRRSEPGEDAPAADSWGPAEPRTFGDPPSMQSRSRLAAAESNDTDPGLGGQAGWPGRLDDSVSTASWAAAGTDPSAPADWAPQEPQEASWGPHDPSGNGWHDSPESTTAAWTAQDAAVASAANWADEPSAADWGEPEAAGPAWNGDHAAPAWNDDEQPARSWDAPADPLTSPSFPISGGYPANGRAAADGGAFTDSGSYRRSHDRARAQYESSPDVFGGAQPDYAGSHSTGTGTGYGASWSGSGGGYSHGSHDRLEPLPEPGGSPGTPSQTWHPAPVSAGDSRSYAEPAAQSWDQNGTGYDAPRHRSDRQSQDDGYSSQDYRDWPDPDARYQQSAGSGYQPSHGRAHGNGYGQEYGQPAADYEPGYDATSHGAEHDGGYGSNGNGYSLPTRGSGQAMNGYGHERGRGQHSGYDNDRWQ